MNMQNGAATVPDSYGEITSGDHRRALTALRDVLATHMLIADSNVAAQIAARLQAVLDQLDAMPVPVRDGSAGPKRNELEIRRASRGATSTIVEPANSGKAVKRA